MRVSELFGTEVVDCDGKALGRVHDARLIQDGPMITGFGAALRVDGLVVGEGAVAVRLGYHRNRITGPWLLRWLAQRVEHSTRYVSWLDVAEITPERITLGRPLDQLPFLRDVA